MVTNKVLIGSTVRQKPAILREFLKSLSSLERGGIQVDCLLVDNNDNNQSSMLLKEFRLAGGTVFQAAAQPTEAYNCDEKTHYWNNSLIWTIAAYKNFILKFALDNNYTHLLMVDSDIVLHPQTLKHLLSTGKHIVSEIFWTEWLPGAGELPQVWREGQYSFHQGGSGLGENEKNRQTAEFLNMLRNPGLYEVGGLGACTLISREAIAKGVNYQRISNVDYWGEDRHLCVRAAVMGFKLYVDTHYPAFHIYRESDLNRLTEVRKNSPKVEFQRKATGNKLTLSMIVRNEEKRYLTRVLQHVRQYIDSAIIIDDASKDNTADLCRQLLEGIPLKLIQRKRSGFSNEYKLRQQQWRETIQTKPDWILVLDADEIFEDRVVSEMPTLLNQTEFDHFSFRLFDFWDENHYREDTYWQAHFIYRPFLIRYNPDFTYRWKETPQHCGRLPCNITELKGATSPLRIKHFGWANPKDRGKKYQRYMKLDPHGEYGILEQYRSILDQEPKLIKWNE